MLEHVVEDALRVFSRQVGEDDDDCLRCCFVAFDWLRVEKQVLVAGGHQDARSCGGVYADEPGPIKRLTFARRKLDRRPEACSAPPATTPNMQVVLGRDDGAGWSHRDRMLVTERGWSRRRYRDWLARSFARACSRLERKSARKSPPTTVSVADSQRTEGILRTRRLHR